MLDRQGVSRDAELSLYGVSKGFGDRAVPEDVEATGVVAHATPADMLQMSVLGSEPIVQDRPVGFLDVVVPRELPQPGQTPRGRRDGPSLVRAQKLIELPPLLVLLGGDLAGGNQGLGTRADRQVGQARCRGVGRPTKVSKGRQFSRVLGGGLVATPADLDGGNPVMGDDRVDFFHCSAACDASCIDRLA